MTALFPPQHRNWSLPAEVPLTPKSAERLAREAAEKAFGPSARSLNIDWETNLDPTQVQRWAEALGRSVVSQRTAEANDFDRGMRPSSPANEPALIIVGIDGGRWQGRDKDADGKICWHEDKVATVTTYIPGDGKEPEQGGREPQKLLSTYVATTGDAVEIALLARVEAERRGIRKAVETVVMGDFAKWIDTAAAERFPGCPRIGDYNHATEYLWDAARAARGPDAPQSPAVAILEDQLETLLYDGKTDEVIQQLGKEAAALGPPQETDGPKHPRTQLQNIIGFFERNKQHMNYPEYRRRGWPIGSGNTEAGVKVFNKRVKGTEQFWSQPGVQAILALRALYTSQDQRWEPYWMSRAAYSKAA